MFLHFRLHYALFAFAVQFFFLPLLIMWPRFFFSFTLAAAAAAAGLPPLLLLLLTAAALPLSPPGRWPRPSPALKSRDAMRGNSF